MKILQWNQNCLLFFSSSLFLLTIFARWWPTIYARQYLRTKCSWLRGGVWIVELGSCCSVDSRRFHQESLVVCTGGDLNETLELKRTVDGNPFDRHWVLSPSRSLSLALKYPLVKKRLDDLLKPKKAIIIWSFLFLSSHNLMTLIMMTLAIVNEWLSFSNRKPGLLFGRLLLARVAGDVFWLKSFEYTELCGWALSSTSASSVRKEQLRLFELRILDCKLLSAKLVGVKMRQERAILVLE